MPPRWKLGALCYARARALGLPEATPPRKFPADHTPVTIRTHQLRSSPGISTRLRRAETARLLAPPAHRCQLNVKLGRHLGSSAAAGNLPTGAGDPTHEDRPPRRIPAPPFWPAVHPRRARPTIAQARSTFTPGRVNRWGAAHPQPDRLVAARAGPAGDTIMTANRSEASVGHPPGVRPPRPADHAPTIRSPKPPFQPAELLDGKFTRPASLPALPRPTAFAQLDQRQVEDLS